VTGLELAKPLPNQDLPEGGGSGRRGCLIRLNGQDNLKKTMQTVANQRETASHELT
jgi:hypothetical protein